MPHSCEIGAKRRAADFLDRRHQRPRCRSRNRFFKRGEDALAVALAERNESHAGGNPVRHLRMQEGVERGLTGDTVTGAGNADGDR